MADSSKENKTGTKLKAGQNPVTGSTSLPVSRVSKIIKADKDITKCTKEATFLISLATEHFIRRLTDAAYTRARMDQRKVVTYKDLSTVCLPEVDGVPSEFFFLEEVVPKPIPMATAMQARKKRIASAGVPFVSSTTKVAAQQHVADFIASTSIINSSTTELSGSTNGTTNGHDVSEPTQTGPDEMQMDPSSTPAPA